MNTCTHIHICERWAWHLVPLGCTSWCSPFFPFELICHPCRCRSRRLVLASLGTLTCFLALTSAGEPTPPRGPFNVSPSSTSPVSFVSPLRHPRQCRLADTPSQPPYAPRLCRLADTAGRRADPSVRRRLLLAPRALVAVGESVVEQ